VKDASCPIVTKGGGGERRLASGYPPLRAVERLLPRMRHAPSGRADSGGRAQGKNGSKVKAIPGQSRYWTEEVRTPLPFHCKNLNHFTFSA